MARKSMTDDPYLEKLFGIESCRAENQKVLVFDGTFNTVFKVSQCGTKAEIAQRSSELSERFSVLCSDADDSHDAEHGEVCGFLLLRSRVRLRRR